MSNLPRRRRVKRPTIIVKRSQLAKNNLFKKRSYKPLYEKLKTNNNALAKALSNEKQEKKNLFTQNLDLTSQVQELGVACNRRDDIISGVLKNAKESLQLLVTLSTYVTNTIACCQQIVTTTRYTPRKSTSNNRRDSTRRLSGKSPARGVVQPMVGGHTITKPTINLSRVNVPREFRVRVPPNLSDVEEALTPEQSPTVEESTTPVRIPIARSLDYGSRRPVRLPERFRGSIRVSDENERRSSERSVGSSGRHSRRSRRTSERLSGDSVNRRSNVELRPGDCLRSPRVALHDVSRLLQNSQSVNIRTLLESSSEMDITNSQQIADPATDTSTENVASTQPEEVIPESSEDPEATVNETPPQPEASRSRSSSKKSKVPSPTDDEDPLEGPSWLLDSTEPTASPSENEVSTTADNATKDRGRSSQRANTEENSDEDEKEERERENRSPEARVERDEQTMNFYRNLYTNEDATTTNLARFVTRDRGSACDSNDEDDDYTLLWKKRGQPQNYNYDFNDLQLPVLESPIVKQVQPRMTEAEPTVDIRRITQALGGSTPGFSRANGEETIFDHTGLVLPAITENLDNIRPSAVVEQDEQSDEEEQEEVVPRKRKRQYKKKLVLDSASDSDWIPTPKRTTVKTKRKSSKTRDPSSAKVVLQKLNETRVKKRTPSTESRQSPESDQHRRSSYASFHQRDGSSDSDVSNASSPAKSAARRPRRQKAPKNLQEPSLTKKMRRN